jgi:hypothetical protein
LFTFMNITRIIALIFIVFAITVSAQSSNMMSSPDTVMESIANVFKSFASSVTSLIVKAFGSADKALKDVFTSIQSITNLALLNPAKKDPVQPKYAKPNPEILTNVRINHMEFKPSPKISLRHTEIRNLTRALMTKYLQYYLRNQKIVFLIILGPLEKCKILTHILIKHARFLIFTPILEDAIDRFNQFIKSATPTFAFPMADVDKDMIPMLQPTFQDIPEESNQYDYRLNAQCYYNESKLDMIIDQTMNRNNPQQCLQSDLDENIQTQLQSDHDDKSKFMFSQHKPQSGFYTIYVESKSSQTDDHTLLKKSRQDYDTLKEAVLILQELIKKNDQEIRVRDKMICLLCLVILALIKDWIKKEIEKRLLNFNATFRRLIRLRPVHFPLDKAWLLRLRMQ